MNERDLSKDVFVIQGNRCFKGNLSAYFRNPHTGEVQTQIKITKGYIKTNDNGEVKMDDILLHYDHFLHGLLDQIKNQNGSGN